MLSYLLLMVLSCIPREDPPEKVKYLEEIHALPGVLNENSGLISHNGLLWYINDSGNEAELYGYSRQQNIVKKTFVIKDTDNNDWEDISENENYVFIGDFGNNAGSRTNLRIIRLNKTDLDSESDTIVPSGIIEFSYEDQTDFTPQNQNTSFDCEAFVATSDSVYLFTKDWVTLKTAIYSISASPGKYQAQLRARWDVKGLITSAVWSSQSKTLYLLGYTPVVPFITTYSNFNPAKVSYSSVSRQEFQKFAGTQTEGIVVTDDGTVIVCSEGAFGVPARLFVLREE